MVPLIAYTPEQYTVYYGTSLGSLASYPTTVAGSTNFSSVDLDYSLNITGLTFDTLYYFYIEASNTEGEATSVTMNFTTLVVTGRYCNVNILWKWRDIITLPAGVDCLSGMHV